MVTNFKALVENMHRESTKQIRTTFWNTGRNKAVKIATECWGKSGH